MPVQDFSLDATGSHRIQVHWASDNDPATILLNGSVFGSLTTIEERTVGKDFTLPDNSILHVHFVNNQPQVLRNGYPLTNAPASPELVHKKKRGGCLTSWLILNLVLISLFTVLYLLALFVQVAKGNTDSHTVAFILFALLGCVGIVGLSALLAWKKWGFYLAALYVVANFLLAFPLGMFDGNPRIFTPLIGIAFLYYLLRKNDLWEQLS